MGTFVALVSAQLWAQAAPTQLPPTNEAGVRSRPNDCGVKALYFLMRLEGKPVSYSELRDDLENPDHGSTLLELKTIAAARGLSLEGRRIPANKPPQARALVFLDLEPSGHFVVIRPTGHTGKLVQLFDGVDDPRIVDFETLSRSPKWTGMALVPARGAGAHWLRGIGLLSLAAALLPIGWTHLPIRKRNEPTGQV